MTQSTVSNTRKSQTVVLPKAVALPSHVKRVEVLKQGNGRLVVPAGGSWQQFFQSPGIDSDFLDAREQPSPRERRTP
jgi:antitoxin VapB